MGFPRVIEKRNISFSVGKILLGGGCRVGAGGSFLNSPLLDRFEA